MDIFLATFTFVKNLEILIYVYDISKIAKYLIKWQHGPLLCILITFEQIPSHSASLLIFTECGGKNFHFVHNSAELESVISGTVRSAFEYGGQKCSACSRMYVPESKWPKIKEGMLEIQKQIKVGSPLEADSFLSAVIDDKVHVKVYSSPKHRKDFCSSFLIAIIISVFYIVLKQDC